MNGTLRLRLPGGGRRLGVMRVLDIGVAAMLLSTPLIATIVRSGLPGASSGPAGSAPATFVRVDQAGYPDHGPKVAYVMSTTALSGEARVESASGTTVATVSLGSSLGAWSSTWSHVYRVDFTSVTADGNYTVTAAGSTSPTFGLEPPGSVYSAGLAHALSFYENQRDGPHYVPSALRDAPGHLNDEHAATYETPNVDGNGNFHGDLSPLGRTIDASGGWWDAGDYLKFVQTASYTVVLMLAGVRSFPGEMGPGAAFEGSDFTTEARFGLQFLMKMWDEESRTLYYQVGIGAGNTSGTIVSDHDLWRLPRADDAYGGTNPADRYMRNRPVFAATPGGSPISPNLAGRLAADFGLCAQVFRASDPSLADACLKDGETVYGLAKTSNVGRLLTAIPYGFYPEVTWQDDMELGATELSMAVARRGDAGQNTPGPSSAFFLGQAAQWAHDYIRLGPGRWSTLNLYDTAGLAHYELYRALAGAGQPRGLAVNETELLDNLGALVDIGVTQTHKTPFGNGAPWNAPDSVSLTDGLSVMASEYDALSATSTYATEAQGWLDENLGANPWGLAFLVGDGTSSPICLSHQVANIEGSLSGRFPVLDGAAVEGPTNRGSSGIVPGMRACSVDRSSFDSRDGVFVDNEQSYATTEPAIDLTASSPLAFSWLASPSTGRN